MWFFLASPPFSVLAADMDDNPLDRPLETPPVVQPKPARKRPTVARDPDTTPPILAKTYSVLVQRRSNSNRLYLLQKTTPGLPEVGRILLVKEGDEALMAFRVVKTYTGTPIVAAKKIFQYGELPHLQRGESYTAVEKLADIEFDESRSADPRQKADRFLDEKDSEPVAQELAEVENGNAALTDSEMPKRAKAGSGLPSTQPFDPVLDGGPIPGSRGAAARDRESVNELMPDGVDGDVLSEAEARATLENPRVPIVQAGEDPYAGDGQTQALIAEEIDTIDIYRHGLSTGIGTFKNIGKTGQAISAAGVQLRYGYTAGNMLLLKSAAYQDSLTLEGGIQLYKLTNHTVANDSYTVMPIGGYLRYNVFFSQNLGTFFFGGLTKSNVIDSANSSADALTALNGFIPSAGVGLLVRVGPHWEVRGDIGIDMQAVGLMVRF